LREHIAMAQLGERFFVEAYSSSRSGGLVMENTDVKMTLNGQDITLQTLAADYIGFTPGAQCFEVTLKNYRLFRPTFNFFAAKANREFVQVRLTPLSGGAPLEMTGHISSPVTLDSADGKNTEEDLTITGDVPNFET
jgi:hypothetical protein